MRLCEATMPEVSPSPTGCTGSAYSFGYSSRCASIARRRRSSASSNGMVLIQVISSNSFRVSARTPCASSQVSFIPRRDEDSLHARRQQARASVTFVNTFVYFVVKRDLLNHRGHGGFHEGRGGSSQTSVTGRTQRRARSANNLFAKSAAFR